jgi:uncharacterized protein (TIGR04255 family)
MLPKKITPDRIRDSIVQVHFTSNIPFEALIGILFKPMNELGFNYTNRHLPKSKGSFPITPAGDQFFEINIPPQHFFFNEKVKIQLFNNSLIFNCLGDYIGWELYISAIKSILEKVTSEGDIACFNRVGIRFVSEFPNIDVFDITNFKLEMKGMNLPLLTGNFKIEWYENPYNIIVNLASKLPLPAFNKIVSEIINCVSLIDIDVILKDIDISKISELFEVIENNHRKQKELFFGLLKEDFLKTLKPEY